MVVGLLLGLYVLVALLNSSVVQSYLGAAAGSYFSKEWGGKVRIGALHFAPLSHIVLDKTTAFARPFCRFLETKPLESLNKSIGIVEQKQWNRRTNPLESFQKTVEMQP